ncbi:MAG: hypothetical protein U0946_02030, partial [Patescibacteria group bacterium]|nr:hypothetical protein [Patescibacteria group bacterium]
MDKIGLNYLPKGLTKKIVQATLVELPSYVKKHKLRSSVYNSFNYRKNQAKIDRFFKLIKL